MDKKNPLTRRGFVQLKHEFDTLSQVERPKVVKGVADAAAEGDRSENAEYIYGKKRLREIDKRLQYLAGLLKHVRVIDEHTLTGEIVCFGSTVVLRDEDDQVKKLTIVGEGESGFYVDSVSYRSPFGRALLGKHVGDLVEIERPKGVTQVEIMALYFGTKLIAGMDVK